MTRTIPGPVLERVDLGKIDLDGVPAQRYALFVTISEACAVYAEMTGELPYVAASIGSAMLHEYADALAAEDAS